MSTPSLLPWVALAVFAPFAVLYMREKVTLNYLGAGLCLVGAVWFIMRDTKLG